MITTKNLRYSYTTKDESNVTLRDVNLHIEKGEFVALLGHNGSGKSTLAKHFNAILLPEGGSVYVKGMDTKNEDFL